MDTSSSLTPRSGGQPPGLAARPGARHYRFAGWCFDVEHRGLTAPDGRRVALTRGECDLLEALCRAPQRVLSRDRLLVMSRWHDDEVDLRAVDVQVRRLRMKLETEPSRPALLLTERGLGYRFACAVESRP